MPFVSQVARSPVIRTFQPSLDRVSWPCSTCSRPIHCWMKKLVTVRDWALLLASCWFMWGILLLYFQLSHVAIVIKTWIMALLPYCQRLKKKCSLLQCERIFFSRWTFCRIGILSVCWHCWCFLACQQTRYSSFLHPSVFPTQYQSYSLVASIACKSWYRKFSQVILCRFCHSGVNIRRIPTFSFIWSNLSKHQVEVKAKIAIISASDCFWTAFFW